MHILYPTKQKHFQKVPEAMQLEGESQFHMNHLSCVGQGFLKYFIEATYFCVSEQFPVVKQSHLPLILLHQNLHLFGQRHMTHFKWEMQ